MTPLKSPVLFLPGHVTTLGNVLRRDPHVAVVGGICEPVFEQRIRKRAVAELDPVSHVDAVGGLPGKTTKKKQEVWSNTLWSTILFLLKNSTKSILRFEF